MSDHERARYTQPRQAVGQANGLLDLFHGHVLANRVQDFLHPAFNTELNGPAAGIMQALQQLLGRDVGTQCGTRLVIAEAVKTGPCDVDVSPSSDSRLPLRPGG
jgi:hypothetical protein